MNKKVVKRLKNEANELFNMDDRLDNVLSKIEFNNNTNISTSKFNFKYILYPVITLLLCFISSLSTYYIVKPKESNIPHEIIINNDENVQVAIEQIKAQCDTYDQFPVYSYMPMERIQMNIYKGIKFSDDIINMYFIQVCYLLDNKDNINVEIINQNNEKKNIDNPIHQQVYTINENYLLTDEINVNMYKSDDLVFSTIIKF